MNQDRTINTFDILVLPKDLILSGIVKAGHKQVAGNQVYQSLIHSY